LVSGLAAPRSGPVFFAGGGVSLKKACRLSQSTGKGARLKHHMVCKYFGNFAFTL